MKKAPIALLCMAACAILAYPSSTSAIPIHQHVIVHRSVGGLDPFAPVKVGQEAVRVVDVAPADSDDDGCPDAEDSYRGPGCNPPPKPAPVASPVSTSIAPAPTTTTVAPTSGGCPSYMAAEASSPTAVNPTSGAAGCYQVLPSTQAAMGAACSDVNSSSCVAAICASSGNAAWASSGATPCDYIGQP